jgi:hypothetical protein
MMYAVLSITSFLSQVPVPNEPGWGLGKGRRLSPFSNHSIRRFFECFTLRPEPGSRVTIIPAHTPRGGRSGFPARPSKANRRKSQRIQYPPCQFIAQRINYLERGVTKP